ncbi:hypothetical protein BH24BAC1_BH24BAC1_04500 [soil metagenome]
MKVRDPKNLNTKPLPVLKKRAALPFLLTVFLWLGLVGSSPAQIVAPVPTPPDPGDTVSVEPVKFKFVPYREWSKPARAAFYAAVLPGAGQAYNRKYWKMPILYGGMGVIGYYIRYNHDLYRRFQRAYVIRTDDAPTTLDEFTRFRDPQTLLTGVNIYRRNRDLSVIIMVGAYAIGILDAHVDAHLKEFDISEDLSFKIKPQLMPVFGNRVAPSVTVKLNLKAK